MGFDRKQATQAMWMCKGDINAASLYLTTGERPMIIPSNNIGVIRPQIIEIPSDTMNVGTGDEDDAGL